MMAIVGTLAYEFQVILPLVAKYTFGGDAATYGIMTGAMGLGAVDRRPLHRVSPAAPATDR